jgi:3-hydroxyacyl-CoA dehydrogenase
MFYADQVGLSEVARALRRIADAPGAHAPHADKAFWTPAALLTRLAEDGKHFSEYKGPSK